jgi:molybdate transport system substrate-binding protein
MTDYPVDNLPYPAPQAAVARSGCTRRSLLRGGKALALGVATTGWLAPAGAADGLLVYCGITMVRPMTEIARLLESRDGVRVQIAQGGSEDLYQSLKKSRVGDLYLPGEPSYRDKHLGDGLLGEFRTVGYNQMALFVAKGNPRRVEPTLQSLLRKDLVVVIGNARSGSVGQETRAMLEAAGLYEQVLEKAAFLMPDSRAITLSLKRAEADLALNWRATAFFPDNAPHMDVVDLPEQVAPPQALLLNQLTFSRQPAQARRFIELAVSPEGQAIWRRYGFLDAAKGR